MNLARTAASAAADRIRIEDEVWDEAFASRVSSRPRRPAVPKPRPAHDWFADPSDGPRPFGVDAPVAAEAGFDAPAGLDAPFGVDAPVRIDAPVGVQAPFGVNERFGTDEPLARTLPIALPATPASQAELAAPGPVSSPARRTIRIEGRGAERNLPVTGRDRYAATATRRRSSSLLNHRSDFEPDRLAMWAMLLGVALVAVAILSSSF